MWTVPADHASTSPAATRSPRATSVTRIARTLVGLVAPPVCAGCGVTGQHVCETCARLLHHQPRPHRPCPMPPGLPPVLALTDYSGPVRQIITAWKERGQRSVAPVLAAALTDALVWTWSADAVAAGCDVPWRPVGSRPELFVVPVPGSRAARRRRGEDAWGRVVEMACREVRSRGIPTTLMRCLTLQRQPRDQAGLSARERRANLSGAMAARVPSTGWRSPSTSLIVLVDDIVTTGATLAEAGRALRQAGFEPPRAIVLSATRRISADRR